MRRLAFRWVVASSLLLVCFRGAAQARHLTLEDRARAQKAVEQVYWNHRIWPTENRDPKPPFSTILSDEAIRGKVEDYIRKSNALEKWWQRPITGKQLQAEMDRMVLQTRDPAVLMELFHSLGDDPTLIAETLARQTLVERLIREWYANDTRLHEDVRKQAESALAICSSATCLKETGGNYHETVWRVLEDRARDASGRVETVTCGAAVAHDLADGPDDGTAGASRAAVARDRVVASKTTVAH